MAEDDDNPFGKHLRQSESDISPFGRQTTQPAPARPLVWGEEEGAGMMPYEQARDRWRATVERAKNIAANAAQPITSYPSTYAEMNREGRARMSEGVEQAREALAEPHSGAGAFKFAGGVGKTALGAAEFTFSPINAAIRTIVGRPIEATTGIPKELPEFATSLALPVPKRLPNIARAEKVPVKVAETPSREALFNAAEQGYDELKSLNVQMKPQSTGRLADNITGALQAQGHRDFTAPSTFRIVNELKVPTGAIEIEGEGREVASKLADVLATRKALNRVARNTSTPEEARAANAAIDAIDTYIGNLGKPRAAIYGEDAAKAAPILQEANANYAAAKRSEALGAAGERAELNASSAGSGANIDNATRQAIKSILRDGKQLRGFSAEEIAQMKKIVRGTYAGNTARLLGKLAPTGVISGTISGVTGAAVGGLPGAVALPVFGFAARKLSDFMTKTQYERLDRMIRSRSPLAQPIESPLRKWVDAGNQLATAPTVQNMVKFQLASSNLSTNLKDVGIRISPDDMLKALQGPMEAPAEGEQ